MVTRQRTDLHMNIPALRKLDAMLIVRTKTFHAQQTIIGTYPFHALLIISNILQWMILSNNSLR